MTTLLLGTIVSSNSYAQEIQTCADICEADGVNTVPNLGAPGYPAGTNAEGYSWSNDIPATGLALGMHTITWTLTNNATGAVAHNATQDISIVDTTAPEFQDTDSNELIASTGFYTSITPELLGGTLEAEDTVDSDVSVTLLGTLNENGITEDIILNLYNEVLAELYPDFIAITISDPGFFNYLIPFIERDHELFEQRLREFHLKNHVDKSLKVTSGFYTAIWQAEDDSGNTSIYSQRFLVIPEATMLQSPTAVIGGYAKVIIELNSKQIENSPRSKATNSNNDSSIMSEVAAKQSSSNLVFEVLFTGTVIDKINGESDSYDSGDIYFEEADVVASIDFEIPDDVGITVNDTLFATISDFNGFAGLGEVITTEIPLTDQNIAPRVELTSYQEDNHCITSAKTVSGIAAKCAFAKTYGITFSKNSAEPVFISANVRDEDDVTLDWEVTGSSFINYDNDLIYFIPQDADKNLITVQLTATDEGGLVTTKSLDILLLSSASPELDSNTDSDNDGRSDQDEGLGDTDGDGIADYLDDNPLLNQLPLGDDNNPMFVGSGITLTLGTTKRSADGFEASNAVISDSDLEAHGNEGSNASGNTADAKFPIENRISPVIDFEVSGFTPGETIDIVIPLPLGVTIPSNAVYRKYTAVSGWKDFTSNSNNTISSAPLTSNDNCPTTDSTDYTSGLNIGDQCIRLSIEDGGPNDADLEANGTIIDPGVLTVAKKEVEVDTTPVVTPVNTTTTTVTITTPDNSGGGSTWLLIWLLLPVTVFRVRSPRKIS